MLGKPRGTLQPWTRSSVLSGPRFSDTDLHLCGQGHASDLIGSDLGWCQVAVALDDPALVVGLPEPLEMPGAALRRCRSGGLTRGSDGSTPVQHPRPTDWRHVPRDLGNLDGTEAATRNYAMCPVWMAPALQGNSRSGLRTRTAGDGTPGALCSSGVLSRTSSRGAATEAGSSQPSRRRAAIAACIFALAAPSKAHPLHGAEFSPISRHPARRVTNITRCDAAWSNGTGQVGQGYWMIPQAIRGPPPPNGLGWSL